MCNYCGCRSITALADLTDEHEQLLNARGELTRAIDRGDLAEAADQLHAVVRILTVHDRVEELALYPALVEVEGYAEQVGGMYDVHDEIDATLTRAAELDPNEVDWDAVRKALHQLARHIDAEEHGLFPAAAVSVDPAVWNRAESVRATSLALATG